MNSIRESTINFRKKLKVMLSELGEVACVYLKNGRHISGWLVNHHSYEKFNSLDGCAPSVFVKSKTGKEYPVLISNLISVNGIEEI